VILPLTLVGTVLGRNLAGQPNYPCRVNAVPRPIPEKKWFMEPTIIVLLGGILPFGSIFIEMYFIFTSFWAYKIYYVYGFMLLVFLILTTVTTCVTIVCTYFLLNAEDYRWYVFFFETLNTLKFYQTLNTFRFYQTLNTFRFYQTLNTFIFYEKLNNIYVSGNGRVSCPARRQQDMYISIHFIITSLKLKCMDSFKPFSTSGIWRYSVSH
jgi:transmembrane 9 superfamily protein 3